MCMSVRRDACSHPFDDLCALIVVSALFHLSHLNRIPSKVPPAVVTATDEGPSPPVVAAIHDAPAEEGTVAVFNDIAN